MLQPFGTSRPSYPGPVTVIAHVRRRTTVRRNSAGGASSRFSDPHTETSARGYEPDSGLRMLGAHSLPHQSLHASLDLPQERLELGTRARSRAAIPSQTAARS